MVSQEVDGAGARCDVSSCNCCQEEAASGECKKVESEVGLFSDRDHAGEIALLVHGGELQLQRSARKGDV